MGNKFFDGRHINAVNIRVNDRRRRGCKVNLGSTSIPGHLNNLLTRGAPDNGVVHQKHVRSEEHTSELQSRGHLVCRLLLEKNKDPGVQCPTSSLLNYLL